MISRSSRPASTVASHASTSTEVRLLASLHGGVTLTCPHRHQVDDDPVPLPRDRPPAAATLPGRRREEHHPASTDRGRARKVQRRHDAGGQGDPAAVQDDAPPAVPHPPHQAVHQEQLCRGEEPDDCQLPAPGRRHAGLCVWPVSHIVARIADPLPTADVDPAANVATYYDLVSNITHSSAAGTAREETTWKAQVHLRPPRDAKGRLAGGLTEDDEKWFQIQDLIVEEINSGMIALGESYIQVSCTDVLERRVSADACGRRFGRGGRRRKSTSLSWTRRRSRARSCRCMYPTGSIHRHHHIGKVERG